MLVSPLRTVFHQRSNEVLAREGIDTVKLPSASGSVISSSNEVLAREGIDTHDNFSKRDL